MFTRVAFGLMALLALLLPWLGPWEQLEEDVWLRRALSLYFAVACGGMVVRWTRWRSPGPSLGFLSKLLGWFAGTMLPFALWNASWNWAAAGVLVPLLALCLWRGWRWAVVPWGLLALGALAFALSGVDDVFDHVDPVERFWRMVPVLVWGHVGTAILRDSLTWWRALSVPRGQAPLSG